MKKKEKKGERKREWIKRVGRGKDRLLL